MALILVNLSPSLISFSRILANFVNPITDHFVWISILTLHLNLAKSLVTKLLNGLLTLNIIAELESVEHWVKRRLNVCPKKIVIRI